MLWNPRNYGDKMRVDLNLDQIFSLGNVLLELSEWLLIIIWLVSSIEMVSSIHFLHIDFRSMTHEDPPLSSMWSAFHRASVFDTPIDDHCFLCNQVRISRPTSNWFQFESPFFWTNRNTMITPYLDCLPPTLWNQLSSIARKPSQAEEFYGAYRHFVDICTQFYSK